MGSLTQGPEFYTALTNGFIAAAAGAFLLCERRTRTERAQRWRLLLGMLLLSGVLGVVTHLFVLPPAGKTVMWLILSPVLCLTALSLTRCAALERGDAAALRVIRPLWAGFLAAAALSAVLILCGAPFLFVPAVYAAACAVFAVRDLCICARSPAGRCCRWMLAGLAAQGVGALGLLARRETLSLGGLCIDHNSVFHLFTLLMIVLFWRGYAVGKQAQPAG